MRVGTEKKSKKMRQEAELKPAVLFWRSKKRPKDGRKKVWGREGNRELGKKKKGKKLNQVRLKLA